MVRPMTTGLFAGQNEYESGNKYNIYIYIHIHVHMHILTMDIYIYIQLYTFIHYGDTYLSYIYNIHTLSLIMDMYTSIDRGC